MIQINENWRLGADQYQWILYERQIDAEKYARLPLEIKARRREFKARYYHPHLEDAMAHLSRLSVLPSDFESFGDLEQRFKKKWEDLVDVMNLNRKGFKKLAFKRYEKSEGRKQ